MPSRESYLNMLPTGIRIPLRKMFDSGCSLMLQLVLDRNGADGVVLSADYTDNGIEISGTCTEAAIDIQGTQTAAGLLISGTAANGIHITGTQATAAINLACVNTADGIVISGTCGDNGIEISGTCTDAAIDIQGTQTAAGLLISGNCASAITISGTNTADITLSGGATIHNTADNAALVITESYINITASGEIRLYGDVRLTSTLNRMYFRNTNTYIQSGADGKLGISVSSGAVDAFVIASAGGITLYGEVYTDSDITVAVGKNIYFEDSDNYINYTATTFSMVSNRDIVINGRGIYLTGTSFGVRVQSNNKLSFRDDTTYIQSAAAGKLGMTSASSADDALSFSASAGGITLYGDVFTDGDVAINPNKKLTLKNSSHYITHTGSAIQIVTSQDIALTAGSGRTIALGGYLLLDNLGSAGTVDGMIWYEPTSDTFQGRANGATVTFTVS